MLEAAPARSRPGLLGTGVVQVAVSPPDLLGPLAVRCSLVLQRVEGRHGRAGTDDAAKAVACVPRRTVSTGGKGMSGKTAV
jgi:hypothetical protein